MEKSTQALAAFLDSAHSVYHAVAYLENLLRSAGYQRLEERGQWNLCAGGRYYLTRGGSAILAFRVPEETPAGFLMSASHSDRPTFKMKENGTITTAYTRLDVEKYGGMLIAPWLDRPLSLAGRVLVQTEEGIQSRLMDIDRDLMLIPNVAIHMNRKANDGYAWNPVKDVLPLLGGKDAAGKLETLLEEAAGGKILGSDLYLYVRQKTSVWGVEEEYISAPALDDLACVWGCTQGFLRGEKSGSIPVLCVFDSEEVGSSSVQGAASTLLSDTLARICQCLNLDLRQMLAQSFLLSADNGHAVHPNHPELADEGNAPLVNKGVVLKFNANLRYTTDGLSAALFRDVAARAGAAVQTYCNRADIPGGSTLGHISLSHVSVPTADIGLPQLAMHSCYETAGVKDAMDLERILAVFYGSTLRTDGETYRLV